MTTNSANEPANEPIDVGNIIATGWKLYTANFSQYSLISLKANLWMFVPLVLFSLINIITPLMAVNPSDYIGFLALLVPAFVVTGILCWAQYLGLSTGISRLAYQSLSGVTETERDALRFTRSRRYSLLWQAILRSLILMAAYFVFVVIAAILIAIAVAVGYGAQGNGSLSLVSLVIGLLIVVGVFAFVCFFVWLSVRIMLADQPLVIEQESGATKAIVRSWELTKGSVLRSLLIAFVTCIIIVPISLVTYAISQLVAYQLLALAPPPTITDTIASFMELLPFLPGILVSILGSIIGSVVTVPLWHTMLTTLYFELRKQQDDALVVDTAV